MRHLSALPRYLLTLPYSLRLSITVPIVLVFLFIFMIIPQASRNPTIFVIPIALVSWMFRRRGMLICLASMVIILWAYYSFIKGTVFLPVMTIFSFLAGTLALLIIGLIICSQRDALELSDAARQQLAHAYEKQQQLNRLKDQLMVNVNHELRTPLTVVSGYLEILLSQNGFLDLQTQTTFLRHALDGCEELQVLINNVLDAMLSGRETMLVLLEEVSVAEVVQQVMEALDPYRTWGRQEDLLQVTIPAQMIVRANATYLRQVLRNLLSNAFKYSPNDAPIVVNAAHDECGPSEVCISVQDAGPGIPPEELPLLFQQFVRLKRDLSGDVRGTGLGLYISKQLVETMGGRIWVESTGIPGRGSRFCFTLPSAAGAIVSSGVEASPLAEVHVQSVKLL